MTKPTEYGHNRIASEPTLRACENAERSPYYEVVAPTRLVLGFCFHLSRNVTQA